MSLGRASLTRNAITREEPVAPAPPVPDLESPLQAAWTGLVLGVDWTGEQLGAEWTGLELHADWN